MQILVELVVMVLLGLMQQDDLVVYMVVAQVALVGLRERVFLVPVEQCELFGRELADRSPQQTLDLDLLPMVSNNF
jgi:hypothetical protein